MSPGCLLFVHWGLLWCWSSGCVYLETAWHGMVLLLLFSAPICSSASPTATEKLLRQRKTIFDDAWHWCICARHNNGIQRSSRVFAPITSPTQPIRLPQFEKNCVCTWELVPHLGCAFRFVHSLYLRLTVRFVCNLSTCSRKHVQLHKPPINNQWN